MLFLVHSDFFGMRYQNYFDSAGQRDRSHWGRELKFFVCLFLLLLINYTLFFALAQCVSPLCLRGSFRVHFALR